MISLKPLLYACNVEEKSIARGNKYSQLVQNTANKEGNDTVIISASIESQIAELENNDDKLELIKEMNLNETTLNKLVIAGYNLLNLINFFTCGPKETRSWTINKNTFAPEAAGKIHSDFEKGFIRAETISYQDYIEFKGEVGSRDSGRLRQEGREYKVKDGDIMHFLFNI